MKTLLTTTLATSLILMLSACGSSGDDQGDLVPIPERPTGNTGTGGTDAGGTNTDGTTTESTSTDSGAVLNPGLFDGRQRVDFGALLITEESQINYQTNEQQILYEAIDSLTAVGCVGTLTILNEDIGPNEGYTIFIQNSEAAGAQTVSIVDINGPTNNVGVEFIYGFTLEGVNFTSVAHIHYFSPDDVTFNSPAIASAECLTTTDRFGQNEAQLRAVLNSVEYLRGSDL